MATRRSTRSARNNKRMTQEVTVAAVKKTKAAKKRVPAKQG
jgi:hypothetical protein